MEMEKFQNKYRVPSARASFWDYGWAAVYFITICTKDRFHYFGEIEDAKMHLSTIGALAQNEWIKTPDIRPDMNISLGEFVVMPDHFHGILIIGENGYHCVDNGIGEISRVSTKTNTGTEPSNCFGPQRKNIASIIRGFKSSVTRHARTINPDFAWQSRFYDHIIRDEPSFEAISNYIITNPMRWGNVSTEW